MTLIFERWIVFERWVSLLMLVTLHIALWSGVQSVWARPFLFAHLGLFLLWQPLWRGEEKLRTRSAVIIVAASVLGLWWLNWWVLAFWVSGIFALVGGRVFAFQSKWQRIRYLLAMGYLLAVLLFWLTPQLFLLSTAEDASKGLMEVVLPLLLVVMALVPYRIERLKKTQAVDLIYSLLLFMLLTLLILGSLAFMHLAHVNYFQALLRTLFFIALILFGLGWLWNPRLGFSGLAQIFSRHFLNMGTPFELWIKQMANAAQQESSPLAFLDRAAEYLAELPWYSGISWEFSDGNGSQGDSSAYFIEVADQDLHIKLFTRQRIAPTMLMHIYLLTQMLGYFFQAKRREQRLREMVHLQAVHETGARLTHDFKNMLQYLLGLISIAELQPAQSKEILQHQLPVLAQRIELILEKLKIPEDKEDAATLVSLDAWWHNLQQRHQYRNLEWVSEGGLNKLQIPQALFDSVVDNLIDNARNKRMRETEIEVTVSLRTQPLRLSVCDNGDEISADMARNLLHTIVKSEDGLGIGLFQAARWAEQSGYQLVLQQNLKGRVCFQLKQKPKG
jgi:signal transduction histidine kinase